MEGPDLNGPAIPPPSGSTSNLDNPPNYNYVAIPIITLCAVLSAIFFMVRFYAKYLGKKINIADYLTAVLFPIFWVYIYFSYRLTWTTGYLVHTWDIRLGDITPFSYVAWVATLLYFWNIAVVKCAILLEWKNIFAPANGKDSYLTWLWYASAATITAFSLILFIMDMVNCTPFESNWNALIPDAYCRFKVPGFAVASSITNLLLELVPLALAQKAIWNLNLSRKKKLGVSGVFFIGILGFISDIVRLYYSVKFFTSNDTSYYLTIMALCCLCETTCAILVLCVPFAPKAISGIQQSKVYSGLKKQYMSMRGTISTASSNSTSGYRKTDDAPYPSKPKEIWVTMSTRVSSNETGPQEPLNRPFNS